MGLGVLPGEIKGLTNHCLGQKLTLLVVHVSSTKRHNCRHPSHCRRRRRRRHRRRVVVHLLSGVVDHRRQNVLSHKQI